jgi:hypothetical protein
LIPSAPHSGVCLSLAIIIHHASSKRQKAAAAPPAPSKEELLHGVCAALSYPFLCALASADTMRVKNERREMGA